ncbi:hypothetical protein JCM6882_002207 [Rhodosporidiobolus microsporus]
METPSTPSALDSDPPRASSRTSTSAPRSPPPQPKTPPRPSTAPPAQASPPGSPQRMQLKKELEEAAAKGVERKKVLDGTKDGKGSFADVTAGAKRSKKKKGEKVVLQSLGSTFASSRQSAAGPATTSAQAWKTPSVAPAQQNREFRSTGNPPTSLPRLPISFLPGGDVSSPPAPGPPPPPPPPHALHPPPPPPPPHAVPESFYPPAPHLEHLAYTPYNAFPPPFPSSYDGSMLYPAFPYSEPYVPPAESHPSTISSSAALHLAYSAPTPAPPLPPAPPATLYPDDLLRDALADNGVLREKLDVFAKLHQRDKEKLAENERERERLSVAVREAEAKNVGASASIADGLKQRLAATQKREEELDARARQMEKELVGERSAREKAAKKHADELASERRLGEGRVRVEKEWVRELQREVERLEGEKREWEEERGALSERVEGEAAKASEAKASGRTEGKAEQECEKLRKECERLRKEVDIRDSILDATKTSHVSALASLRSEHAGALSHLRDDHDRAVESVRRQGAERLKEEQAWVERLSKEQVRDNSRAAKEKREVEREVEELKERVGEEEGRVRSYKEQLAAQGRSFNELRQRHDQAWTTKLENAAQEAERRVDEERQTRVADAASSRHELEGLEKELQRVTDELAARTDALSFLEHEAATSLDELLAEHEKGQREKEMLERRVMALEMEVEEGKKTVRAANASTRRGTSSFLSG